VVEGAADWPGQAEKKDESEKKKTLQKKNGGL
jgi:hypothetical protein